MASSSTWSGMMNIGQISIALRMYTGAGDDDDKVSFRKIHALDKGAVKTKNYCEVCKKELGPGEILKGYDHTHEKDGELVTETLAFTDEEVKKLKPASPFMRLYGFCDLFDVPIETMSKPYYLSTGTAKNGGSGQMFTWLREIMKATKKVAAVSWVMRDAEHFGVMIPRDEHILVMEVRRAEQLRPFDGEVLTGTLSEALLSNGARLVEKMTIPFKVDMFKETYNNKVRELIDARAKGIEIPAELLATSTGALDLEAELAKMLS